MEKQKTPSGSRYTNDIRHILKSLWHRAWIILLCGLSTAAVGFAVASFVIDPTYSSQVSLYITNDSYSVKDESPDIPQSPVPQTRLRTCGEILKSRGTLEQIAQKAGVGDTWEALSARITYESANQSEILRITVTAHDPNEASSIANAAAEVLPARIAEITSNVSVSVVDRAIPETAKIAPNIANWTVIGLVIGIVGSLAVLFVISLADSTVHDEDYVRETYRYPILGSVSNLPDAERRGGRSRFRGTANANFRRKDG